MNQNTRRRLLSLVPHFNRKLHGLSEELSHIEKWDLESPEVVICGNCASGKTAVIEALINKELPIGYQTVTTEFRFHRGTDSKLHLSRVWGSIIYPTQEFVQGSKNMMNAICSVPLWTAPNGGLPNVCKIEAYNLAWPNISLIDTRGLNDPNRNEQQESILRNSFPNQRQLSCRFSTALSVWNLRGSFP
jgi:GTPase SAR1 family protein